MLDSIRYLYPGPEHRYGGNKYKEKINTFLSEIEPIFTQATDNKQLSKRMAFIMMSELSSQHVGLPYSKPIADEANKIIDSYKKGENLS